MVAVFVPRNEEERRRKVESRKCSGGKGCWRGERKDEKAIDIL